MLDSIKEGISGAGILALVVLMPLGGLYWVWMAIQLGSFFMFFLGVAGPFALLTAPIGAYAFLFGMPEWIESTFG